MATAQTIRPIRQVRPAAAIRPLQPLQPISDERRDAIKRWGRSSRVAFSEPTEISPAEGTDEPLGISLARLDHALLLAAQSADPMAWLLAHASSFPLLSSDGEQALALQLRDGTPTEARRARERLVVCNLRLVIRMAVRFQHAARGLELADLAQEGVIGLMRAIEKFEPRMEYKLSTYATWWIAQGMSRAATAQGHAIRLPQHLFDKRRRALRVRSRLTVELGGEPTLEQWSAETGIAPEDLSLLLLYGQPVMSLDARLAPDAQASGSDDRTFADLLADPASEEELEQVEQGEESAAWLVEVARYALRHDRRGARRLHIFVAHARDGVTLEALGSQYGVTREAIRQDYERARVAIAAALIEIRAGDGEDVAQLLAALHQRKQAPRGSAFTSQTGAAARAKLASKSRAEAR